MYHANFVAKVQALPLSLGVRLGRWAIFHDIPVSQISAATGATRQTVYNWMRGGEVTPAYRVAVERVLACLQSTRTTEEARRKICSEFNLSS